MNKYNGFGSTGNIVPHLLVYAFNIQIRTPVRLGIQSVKTLRDSPPQFTTTCQFDSLDSLLSQDIIEPKNASQYQKKEYDIS